MDRNSAVRKNTVVTAADETYIPFLDRLLNTIFYFGLNQKFSIVVFDCGLTTQTRDRLIATGLSVRDAPHHRVAVPGVPSHYRAMTLRPELPSLLAEAEFILWLDADCWIQDPSVLGDYLSAASNSDIACCGELDQSYSSQADIDVSQPETFAGGEHRLSLFEQWVGFFERFHEQPLARRLAAYPLINAGVFCAHRNSPIWSKWEEKLSEYLLYLVDSISADPFLRRLDLLADQTALNTIIRLNDLKVGYLPATHNWLCHRAMPLVDPADDRLLERCWPYDAIKIVHLTTSELKRDRLFDLEVFRAGGRTADERMPRALRPIHRTDLRQAAG